MKKITVTPPQDSYDVIVGEHSINFLETFVSSQTSNHYVILTDNTVGPLHSKSVRDLLEKSDVRVEVVEIPSGEVHKNLKTVQSIYAQLLEIQTDRQSTLIALGGGVVGDIAGFVAATFMRGIPIIHLPTTLLAMVDSSLGGKTAVDLPEGKNLVGAFKQPQLVISDTLFLRTLPKEEYHNGMAEIIKHAIIGDVELFDLLESGSYQELEMILKAIQVKVEIINEDPFEKNIRAHLNLGHTFAHAFEKLSSYQMPHGQAVALGIICASQIAQNKNLLTKEDLTRILALLKKASSLPQPLPENSAEAIWNAMKTDKKKTAGRVTFILPTNIGTVIKEQTVELSEIKTLLENLRSIEIKH